MNNPNKSTSNKFLDKVLVTDFAQLALDIYDDPNDNKIKLNEFNSLWVRKRTWTDTDLDYMNGTKFKAGLYIHTVTNIGIISVRGTANNITNFEEDGDYAFNKDSKIFHGIRTFFNLLKKNNDWLNLKKQYVCGHSLGGILAKYVINTSKCDTITFNSPGVKEYLKRNNCAAENMSGKEVVTYYANGDAIGNFHRDKDHDIGEHNPVNVLDGPIIPNNHINSIAQLTSDDAIEDTFEKHKPMYYHGMIKMYEALKNSEYKDSRF